MRLLVPLSALVLAASLASADPDKPRWSDKEVLQRVYDRQYKHPKDFHVAAVMKPGVRFYCHQNFWLARDAKKARSLVEELLAKSNVDDKKIQETKVTKRGFDFRAGPTWYRVHNRAYFDWTEHWVAFDTTLGRDGKARYLGTFGPKWVSAAELREFAEYEWLMRHRNGTGEKVLASESRATKTHLVHVLETTGFVGGDWGLADRILRFRVTYSVDRKTGKTTKARKLLRTITGQAN